MSICDSAHEGARYSHPWLAKALYALDVRLRRRHHVLEYSSHPSCIFRLELARSSRTCVLSDGTWLRSGERVARLHFWNEQIPPLPRDGATIGWARRMRQGIAVSLQELAHYLSSRPDLNDVAVIAGDIPSGTRTQSVQLARIMAHYGFETIAEPAHVSMAEYAHRIGENILISLFVFARNANALRPDTLGRVRLPTYLSRRTLWQRFGSKYEPLSATVEAS
jgi:hypothetical protein